MAVARKKAQAQAVTAALLFAVPYLYAGDLRLIDAVKEQDHKAVDSLLRAKVDVNTPQPDGATALGWAVYTDQVDMVDSLLKAGAKVNVADEYGDTPLTLACTTGNTAIIQKLIAAGADVKAARWDGESALMLASRAGSLEGVKALIAQGADVNRVETHKGQTALMWAAAEGHSEVVEFLVKSGADAKAASKAGFTPIVFAAQKGDAASVSTLLKAGADVNYTIPSGTPLLQVATLSKHDKVVEMLLANGAKVDAADKTGTTSMHIAAQLGNLEVVKSLIAHGAKPDVKTNHVETGGFTRSGGGSFFRLIGEQTPLMMAARANHEDVMHALAAAGADPKLKAQDGSTLLMAAAGSGHVEVVKYAYELDPDVNAVTDQKRTVMHASVFGSMQNSTQQEVCKVIQFLADKGADLDPLDASGRTPMTIANFLPIDKAVELLNHLITAKGGTPKQPTKR